MVTARAAVVLTAIYPVFELMRVSEERGDCARKGDASAHIMGKRQFL
jgi:hypothetical protein